MAKYVKLCDKDITEYVVDRSVQFLRTFKGEISRNLKGEVSTFPESFITVGVTLSLIGPREDLRAIEQIALSANEIELGIYDDATELDFLGMFSCTENPVEELRDKGDRSLSLTLKLVSTNSKITDYAGNKFVVKKSDGQTVSAYLGETVSVVTGDKLNGITIPNAKLLVLKSVVLTQ